MSHYYTENARTLEKCKMFQVWDTLSAETLHKTGTNINAKSTMKDLVIQIFLYIDNIYIYFFRYYHSGLLEFSFNQPDFNVLNDSFLMVSGTDNSRNEPFSF